MSSDFHWDPDSYLEQARSIVPRYDELQEAAIEAIPFEPKRVLELGFGTAETTERLWQRYPEARITGLDSSADMVFKARQLGWEEMRLGRIEDPLPDGPWDLVIAVLVMHHLGDDRKRDVFRRVRAEARSLVIGDVVAVADAANRTPLPAEFVSPATAADLAEWCDGEVAWEADDLAVIRATYE